MIRAGGLVTGVAPSFTVRGRSLAKIRPISLFEGTGWEGASQQRASYWAFSGWSLRTPA